MPPKIEFESQDWQPTHQVSQKRVSRITQFVIDNSGGKLKDEKQAAIALIVIAAIILVLSIVIFKSSGADIVPHASQSFT